MITFELQKSKVIFRKGVEEETFEGEDYRKLYKVLSKISRSFKSKTRRLFGVTWHGFTIELNKILKIGKIVLTPEHWLKVVVIWRNSEKGVYCIG